MYKSLSLRVVPDDRCQMRFGSDTGEERGPESDVRCQNRGLDLTHPPCNHEANRGPGSPLVVAGAKDRALVLFKCDEQHYMTSAKVDRLNEQPDMTNESHYMTHEYHYMTNEEVDRGNALQCLTNVQVGMPNEQVDNEHE